MPTRAIAKKRCRVMVEPPEKGERATPNPNLSTRLKPTFFDSGAGGGSAKRNPLQVKAMAALPILPAVIASQRVARMCAR